MRVLDGAPIPSHRYITSEYDTVPLSLSGSEVFPVSRHHTQQSYTESGNNAPCIPD